MITYEACFAAQTSSGTSEEWEAKWDCMTVCVQTHGGDFNWKPDPLSGDRRGELRVPTKEAAVLIKMFSELQIMGAVSG